MNLPLGRRIAHGQVHGIHARSPIGGRRARGPDSSLAGRRPPRRFPLAETPLRRGRLVTCTATASGPVNVRLTSRPVDDRLLPGRRFARHRLQIAVSRKRLGAADQFVQQLVPQPQPDFVVVVAAVQPFDRGPVPRNRPQWDRDDRAPLRLPQEDAARFARGQRRRAFGRFGKRNPVVAGQPLRRGTPASAAWRRARRPAAHPASSAASAFIGQTAASGESALADTRCRTRPAPPRHGRWPANSPGWPARPARRQGSRPRQSRRPPAGRPAVRVDRTADSSTALVNSSRVGLSLGSIHLSFTWYSTWSSTPT